MVSLLGLPQRLTVRHQMLSLVLVVVVPAAAAVGWALSAVLDSEQAAATARIRSTANQVASQLGLVLQQREVQMVQLGSRLSWLEIERARCASLFAEFSRLPPDLLAVSLRSPDGRLLCTSGADPLAAAPVAGSPWFVSAQAASGMRAGPMLPGATPGSWTVPLSAPLRSQDGTVLAVLVLALDLPTLQRAVMPAGDGASGLVSVIDGQDALMMRSSAAPDWLGKPPPPALAARTSDRRDAVLTGEGLDGVRRRFVFAGVPGTDWRVVVGLPEQAVLARYHTLLATSAVAGLLGMALMLALARRLSHRIVRPIQALAATSERVAAGDLAARATVAGPLEVQAVATRFNQMLEANRETRQRLETSEAEHRFLIDHLFAGVVVHAPDTSVLLANARAAELLGLTTAQMAGKQAPDPAWRFLREDGTPMPVADYPVTRVIRSGRPLVDLVGAVERPGQRGRCWLLLNAYPQWHADGLLRQVVVSFVDITARKQAELTLARSESRWRMLFDNNLDGVLQTRPDGTVLAANPAACAMFGLTEAEVCQRGRVGLVEPNDPRLAALLAERALTGHANGVVTMVRSDGRRFEAELSSSLYTDPEGRLLASLVLRDISPRLAEEQARARLETQLREAQKMEAIGTLAGGIAHDFNNILGGLLGHAALASATLDDGHPARAGLAQITRAGQRGRALVQQILAFSRRTPQARERQCLRALIDETLGLLRATLPAGVALHTDFTEAPVEVLGDATQLQQVLMNLCTNAWQALGGPAARPGGRIGVRLGVAWLSESDPARAPHLPPGRYAQLRVTDNGAGMDEATRQRVFEPFFTTKAVDQGTGLGLSVAHGIVTAHGGDIVVHSQPGEGSRFDVYLPLAEAAAGPLPGPTAVAAAAPGAGQRVLCVDDDEVMLLMVEQLLSRCGYQVLVCPGATPALALLSDPAQPLDLLVTDHNMPDGSGLELAAAALRLRPGLPVVLTSGYLPEELQTQARALGVPALLNKENTVEELPGLVARLLEKAAAPGLPPQPPRGSPP